MVSRADAGDHKFRQRPMVEPIGGLAPGLQRADDGLVVLLEVYEQELSYGFFDTVDLSTGPLRVNGNVQEMFYDEPKSPPGRQAPAAEWINEQVREFILRYFMRISDYREPEVYPEGHPSPPPGLGLFSQCPKSDPERVGFGFMQEYLKSSESGEIEQLKASDRYRIVDMRRLGKDFEWIVVRNPIFDFSFQVKPFGNSGPQLVLPIQSALKSSRPAPPPRSVLA